MNPSETAAAPFELTPSIVAMGGVEHPIPALGERPAATIKIRILAVAEYSALFAVIDDEYALVALVCVDARTGAPLPATWAASLAPAELMEIVEKIDVLNFQSACRWAERRARIEGTTKKHRLTIETLEKVVRTLEAFASAPASPSASPPRPSPAP
ncbi:hypothetical protein OpiT1DRAFT_00211 [Opitutaceae bacterium TAV1]|nr:hypothetical protein OpiT1DRAFT_00211 [Opitutaceae bacterium TAV1]